MNTTSRRHLLAGICAAPAALAAPALAAPADTALLTLEAEREALWSALNTATGRDLEELYDDWAALVEEIAETPASGLTGVQVKARTLQQWASGCMISQDEDSADGRLLRSLYRFVLTGEG